MKARQRMGKATMQCYQQDIKGCFDTAVGSQGISEAEFHTLLAEAQGVVDEYKTRYKALPLFSLVGEQAGLAEIQLIAEAIRKNFKHLVVLGTGGSSLNGQALTGLNYCENLMGGQGIRVHFMDNVDPYQIDCLLAGIKLETTAFLVISKSGKTLETLAQIALCIDVMRPVAQGNLGRHFYFISDPIDNPLRKIGQTIGATLLDHEENIGGRFSTFTNVGLLPACVMGLNIAAFRAGAQEVVSGTFQSSHPSEAAKGAAINVAWMRKGYSATVMMAYVDRLASFVTWYRQIWSESLGKNGQGTTPIKAMGTLDQHSQLQLYLDGPKDKGFTLIALDTKSQGHKLCTDHFKGLGLEYLNGLHMGDVLEAEHKATADTLINKGHPVRLIRLQELNEKTLGALIMHSILETVIVAGMTKVNPFDQPAVEDGKILARKILERAAGMAA